jgi:hypothetical protein
MLYWPPMPRGEIARMIAAAAAITVPLAHPTFAGFTTTGASIPAMAASLRFITGSRS